MKRRTFDESADGAATHDVANPARQFLCRVPGCRYRWAVDMSHGKVCSMHDDFFSRNPSERSPAKPGEGRPIHATTQWWQSPEPARPLPLQPPKREPVRPYAEASERDDGAEF